jgi:uncharacterized protein
MNLIVALVQIPSRALVAFLRLYQRVVSPAIPVLFGPACGCRFAPSCSHYAIEAVREHGAALGGILAMVRLIKCTPLHPGGFDPVPPRGKFSCTLISHPHAAKADSHIG